MLQYYLRTEDLALSWVGTGRFIFSLDYTEADFAAVAERFLRATRAMREDAWWPATPTLTNRWIRQRVLHEMIQARF
jgi:glutamate-1-semialdehyde 2,1-aminomutase